MGWSFKIHSFSASSLGSPARMAAACLRKAALSLLQNMLRVAYPVNSRTLHQEEVCGKR